VGQQWGIALGNLGIKITKTVIVHNFVIMDWMYSQCPRPMEPFNWLVLTPLVPKTSVISPSPLCKYECPLLSEVAMPAAS